MWLVKVFFDIQVPGMTLPEAAAFNIFQLYSLYTDMMSNACRVICHLVQREALRFLCHDQPAYLVESQPAFSSYHKPNPAFSPYSQRLYQADFVQSQIHGKGRIISASHRNQDECNKMYRIYKLQ